LGTKKMQSQYRYHLAPYAENAKEASRIVSFCSAID
jgi:hypothetical protein